MNVNVTCNPNSGVGLAGMRERMNDLKGDLEIASADPGTRLRAIVPLPAVARSDQHRDCGHVTLAL